MARRVHVERVELGQVQLPPGPAHHVRDVLRLVEGREIEVFDDAGRTGAGRLVRLSESAVVVEVESWTEDDSRAGVTIAAAVPKGQRADWMIEKLGELGVACFVPLATGRSVVHPEGRGKLERWQRIATEAARQSRSGVMRIEALTRLNVAIEQWRQSQSAGFYGVTEWDAPPLVESLRGLDDVGGRWCFVGPEGGWTDEESLEMRDAGMVAARWARTILRIETAAVSCAAVMAAVGRLERPSDE